VANEELYPAIVLYFPLDPYWDECLATFVVPFLNFGAHFRGLGLGFGFTPMLEQTEGLGTYALYLCAMVGLGFGLYRPAAAVRI